MPGKSNKKQPKAARGKAANPPLARGAGGARKRLAPVATGYSEMSEAPRMVTNKGGDARVIHREYIADVTGSGSTTGFFVQQALVINPGQAGTFPWLSAVAQRYESYRFRKLRFCYETEAPTSQGGSIVLSVDYDAIDAPPVSKQQAMAYESAVRSPPWADCCHDSMAKNLNKQKSYFVRPGALPAGGTLTQYDVGNMFVCLQNVTESVVCGELYVEYDVDLITPVFEGGTSTGSAYLYNATGTGATTAELFGTGAVNAGTYTISAANDVVTVAGLVVGQEYYGSFWTKATTAATPSVGTFVGATAVTNPIVSGGSTLSTSYLSFTFTANAINVSFTLTQGTLSTPTQIGLIVAQMPSASAF
jgi:hypothetical protein